MSSAEDRLAELIRGRRTVVLTGAGISTESGIPDYRGPETARRARNPIQYRQFAEDPAWRARYWARSYVGWPRMQQAVPNQGHLALARLGWPIITQNVDGLHQAAGSRQVVDLHGRLSEVVCLDCGAVDSRSVLQDRLGALNPGGFGGGQTAPDGDVDLDGAAIVPSCARCGGVLKPHVVFFGENVPRDRVDRARRWVADAEVLLVVGTSLTVFSGYRFVKQAVAASVPVAIVNLTETRGDPLATLRVGNPSGIVLQALEGTLQPPP